MIFYEYFHDKKNDQHKSCYQTYQTLIIFGGKKMSLLLFNDCPDTIFILIHRNILH